MKTDFSNFIDSRVLSQLGGDGLLNPIAFFSKNFNSTKCNYMIYDKELFAIIKYFEQQKLKLKEIGVLVKVIIDYKSFEYFMTMKKIYKTSSLLGRVFIRI